MGQNLQNLGLGALVTSAVVLFGSFFIKDNLPDRPPLGYVRNQKPYSAVVYGSSGAIGRSSVKELAKSDLCKRVGAVVRKNKDEGKDEKRGLRLEQGGQEQGGQEQGGQEQGQGQGQGQGDLDQKNILFAEGLTKTQLQKIQLIHVNYDKISDESEKLNDFDNAICALGTTKRKAGSSEKFREVDLVYVLKSANISHKNGVRHFSLVTSMGADVNSSLLYPQTKGEAEEECKKVGFNKLSIFRPGLLITPRNESRPFERVAQIVFPHFHWLLNIVGLGKFRAVHVDRVAEAMRWNIEKEEVDVAKVETFENGDILQLDVSKKK